MIAYHILCHDNFKQVTQLLDALYCEDDLFLLDIDDGKNPDTRAVEKFRKRPNVHLRMDGYIGWGGSGTLRKTLEGAFELLGLGHDWQYYIVLSGQDLPLKSNASIKEFLARGHENATSFIRAVEKKPVALADVPLVHKGNEVMLWSDRGHTRIYAEPGVVNPQFDMYARTLVDVTEVSNKGEVYLRNCNSLLLHRRAEFFQQYPLHVGANWFNLHRSVIEYMHDDPFCYELFDVLRSTFIPDESFFQTYIKNSVFRDKTSRDYGRFILRPADNPRVKVFEFSDWQQIAQTDDLFARKFDTRRDKRIVDKVLAQRI